MATILPKARLILPSETPRLIDIISAAFANTAITNAIMVDTDKTPPPYPSALIDIARQRKHFASRVEMGAGAETVEAVEAGDWSAIAQWELPEHPKEEMEAKVEDDGSMSLRSEWNLKLRERMAEYLHGREYYHLQFLARNPRVESVKGAIRAVVEPYLERAKKDGVPCWLEATYPKAVTVYERFGFRVVDVITIGEGRYSSEGWPEDGGNGVKGWCMLWEP